MNIALIGIDTAKSVFHLHGVDSQGRKVFEKRLSRVELPRFISQVSRCRIVMEACGGSNYWGRLFASFGHEVQLIAPQYVKPFVRGNKNDSRDAEAICTAAQQAHMRYVPQRSVAQQEIQNLHRVRQRLVKNRTGIINQLRGFFTEYGVVLPCGRKTFARYFRGALLELGESLSGLAQQMFEDLWQEYQQLEARIAQCEKELKRISKQSDECSRLMTIPGVGYLSATALVAGIGDTRAFKNGRELAAWLGLVPREHSTGGKQRLFGITKRGDTYLRTLLIHGARSALRHLDKRSDVQAARLKDLLTRKGVNRSAVALANRNARVVWALLVKNECYKPLPLAA